MKSPFSTVSREKRTAPIANLSVRVPSANVPCGRKYISVTESDLGMKQCPVLEFCRFFNNILENMPSISESLKEQYCLGDNSDCARYIILNEIGGENLPDDVFPHQKDKGSPPAG
jgi:hypothetical protein